VNWQVPLVLLQHEPGDPGECEASEQQETLSSVRLTNLHLQLLAANKNFIFILWPSRKQKEKLKPKRRTEKRKSNNSDTYVHATLKEWSAYKTKERNMTPYGIFMRELLWPDKLRECEWAFVRVAVRLCEWLSYEVFALSYLEMPLDHVTHTGSMWQDAASSFLAIS